MNIESVQCRNRREAEELMPWAFWIVKVNGGYRGFENGNDYKLFNGKYSKRHEVKRTKYLGWN